MAGSRALTALLRKLQQNSEEYLDVRMGPGPSLDPKALLDLVRSLSANTSVRSLNVCCRGGADGFLALAEGLLGMALARASHGHAPLQSLGLDCSHTSVTEAAGAALAQALQGHASLRSFSLDCYQSSLADATGIALAQALRCHSSLQNLSISCYNTFFSDATGTALAQALQGHTSLRSFSLVCRGHSLTDATGTALAQFLQGHASLQSFHFGCSSTSITDATGTALAQALRGHASLQSFSLECYQSRLTDATGTALAQALQDQVSLQIFSLVCRGHALTDTTGTALAHALRGHASLQSFSLDCFFTALTGATVTALARALQGHASLQSFSLSCAFASLTDAAGAALAQALRGHNTSLLSFSLLTDFEVSGRVRADLVAAVCTSCSLTAFTFGSDMADDEVGIRLQRHLELNRQLLLMWRQLALVAWKSLHPGVRELAGAFGEPVFVRRLLAFLLPNGDRFWPSPSRLAAPRAGIAKDNWRPDARAGAGSLGGHRSGAGGAPAADGSLRSLAEDALKEAARASGGRGGLALADSDAEGPRCRREVAAREPADAMLEDVRSPCKGMHVAPFSRTPAFLENSAQVFLGF